MSMGILDICPKKTAGFTLPELIVVLVVVSLTAALVVPNLNQTYNSVKGRLEKEEGIGRLNSLGSFAFSNSVRVDSNALLEKPIFENYLPDGWSAQGDFVYKPNGACLGGDLQLYFSEVLIESWSLSPPFCQIELDE